MAEWEERRFDDFVVRIDRTLCVGFGDCIEEGGGAFALDEEGLVVFLHPEHADREALVRACESCPVDALSYVEYKEAEDVSGTSSTG
jgi:Uncharacterized conserved protein